MAPTRSRTPADLSAFCEANDRRLVQALALYCADRALAEEIAQDALVLLCRDWRKVRRMDNPEGWLYRVSINLLNSHFRRRAAAHRAQVRLRRESVGSWVDPSDVELLDALADMPPRQRAALLLRHFVGLSTRETADALGCPEGTVKTLVHKGVQRLRETTALTGEEVPHDAR
jgi:RNA polymerase sigma factor (sigma-70 family)